MFANQVAVAVGFGGEPETTLGALEEKKRCFLYVEDSTILHFTHLSTDASDLTQNGTGKDIITWHSFACLWSCFWL